ncbi:MAG: hypothetical protein R2741_15710 [Methanolobus sp.]
MILPGSKEELSSIAEKHDTFGGAFGAMAQQVQASVPQTAAPKPEVSEETRQLQDEAKRQTALQSFLLK